MSMYMRGRLTLSYVGGLPASTLGRWMSWFVHVSYR
jgi:hypothetical protein